MPLIRKEGKDTIIFASKEDHASPSNVNLPEAEPSPGLLLANGEINWNCPCLGGMATGPCGVEFREAFSCFHYSTAEPKGSDCYEAFKTMQVCMSEYPALYAKKEMQLDDIEDEEDSMDQASIETKEANRKEILDTNKPKESKKEKPDISSSETEVEQAKIN